MKRAFAAGLVVAIPGLIGSAARADPVQLPSLVQVTITTDEGPVPAALDWNSIRVLFDADGEQGPASGPFVGTPDDPHLAFTSGEPYRLGAELFFDTFEEGTSVRELTDTIAKLAVPSPDSKRPPLCIFTWGGSLAFKCVLESFSLRFTLFLDDGTPVRAVMDTVWKEFSPAEDQLKGNPRH